jgi:hypothetical protein
MAMSSETSDSAAVSGALAATGLSRAHGGLVAGSACLLAASLANVAVFLSGCGNGLVPVDGKVLLDGEPIAGATVSFLPEQGSGEARPANGKTDAAGVFRLRVPGMGEGAFPGRYRVAVMLMKQEPLQAAKPAKGPVASAGEEGDAGSQATAVMTPVEYIVPAAYGSIEESGLSATVTGKTSGLMFELSRSFGSENKKQKQ